MAEETKIIRIVVDASRAVDGSAAATRALANLEKQQAATASTLDRMEQSLGRLGGYMKAQLALMAADLAARFVQMGKDSLAAAAGLDELSEQLGVTTAGLQAMQFSAVQNGVKLEQLETGISKFSQKLGDAADGSKEVIEALDRLGVKNLDLAGKMRPTEDVLTDVARAIVSMEDPAKRSAAAVDLFGKTGTRMLPMLKDIAGGFDEMGRKARDAGAFIERETIEKLDRMADKAEVAGLKFRAMFANMAAEHVTGALEKTAELLERFDQWGRSRSIADWFRDLTGSVVGFSAAIEQGLAGLPKLFADAFAAAMNAAIEKVELGLNHIGQAILKVPGLSTMLGGAPGSISLPRLDGGSGWGGYTSGIAGAYTQGKAGFLAPYLAADAANAGADAASAFYGSEAGGYRGTRGGRLSAIKGAGQGEADRLAKLDRDTGRDVAAAVAYAEASERGARAVADLEIHFKALKAAQDAYGATADKNASQVAALTAKIEEQYKAAERAKALKDFNLGTEELQRSNELLAAENALINASVEDRAREIALIKLKHDVQSKGLDETNEKEREAIERRREAITANERLKAQGEELKKANEMWTEPLKNALRSIQSTAADMWERILENGKFSMEEFGQLFIRTARRAAAELLALATIRPIIGMGVQALGSIGLVSPQTASALGYGGGTGGLGGSTGGLGGFSMPGGGFGGGLSGSLGSFGQWLNTPLTGPYAGMSPASMQGVPMLSPSLTNPSSWGITPLQGIGAVAGIGSGIFQLATGNGSTGSTIGGIGSMIGGAVSLIPGIGQIAGPLIALGSSLLGGLFGGEGYKPPPLVGSSINFGWTGNGYGSNFESSMNGGQSLAGDYGWTAAAMNGWFQSLGGVTDGSKVWGNAVWQNNRDGRTSTYLIDPSGNSQGFTEGSGVQSPNIDRMLVETFKRSIYGGAIANLSPSFMTALGNANSGQSKEITYIIELSKAYDALGKVTVTAEKALTEINAQFADLTRGAQQYGLSLEPITREQNKLRTRYAQDFIDAMLNPQAAALRQLEDQRKDSIASAEYIRDNVKDVFVDMARITEYWNNKRLDLEAQYQEQSVGQLQALIRRLTYGDLANASPDTSLAGTRGTYEATLAQARAGSGVARANLAAAAEAYAGAGRSYFASSAEYDAIVASIRGALIEVVGGTGMAAGGAANGNNPLLQTVAEQSGMVAALVAELREVKDQLAAATAQMQRRG